MEKNHLSIDHRNKNKKYVVTILFLLTISLFSLSRNFGIREVFAEAFPPYFERFSIEKARNPIQENSEKNYSESLEKSLNIEKNKVNKTDKESNSYKDGEVLIKFKTNAVKIKNHDEKSKKFLDEFSAKNNLKVKRELSLDNYVLYKITDGKKVKDKVNELKGKYEIESVQPNFKYKPLSISTNDTDRSKLWGLDNTGQSVNGVVGTPDADIDAPEAWALSLGTTDVIVAVIDNGVAYNHPDLANMMWDGSSCKGADGNYLGGCLHGFDYEDIDVDPAPDSGSHGTHVAGIIAAQRNNSVGILGVAPRAKIMAIKTDYSTDQVIEGIEFAKQNGAKVINASWGSYGTVSEMYDAFLYDSISSFPGLFIVAAGNEGYNHDDGVDSHKSYPDGFKLATPIGPGLENIIVVAAIDIDNELVTLSNWGWGSDYGINSVDVGAPGTDIYSTVVPSILEQTFESTITPNIPTGWTKGGSYNNWGTYNLGGAWGKVLYGSLTRYPYINERDTYITTSKYNLGTTSPNTPHAQISFWTRCDTEYIGFNDYMQLEYSSDGIIFLPAEDPDAPGYDFQWNESWLDDLEGDSSSLGSATHYYEDILIPDEYLTSNFKIRLRWVADYSLNNYYGCLVDDIQIVKYNNGSNGTYGYMNGTSMATPYTVGLAAYLWSVDPTLTTDEVKNIILSTGDSLASLSGKTSTGKRINMFTAVGSILPPVLKQVTSVPATTLNTAPSYTFSSNEAGTISYEGDCTSGTFEAVKGNNPITFNPLSFGTHSNCVIKVADIYNNESSLSVTPFTVQSGIKPALSQVAPVITPSNNTAPSYTFHTTKPGTIIYGGPCSSVTTVASEGENTVTFNPLATGTYSTCTIKVRDYELQLSNVLTVKAFTIDATPPTLKQVTPVKSSTNDTTPNYVFNSTEAGSITYGGDCSGVLTTSLIAGNKTITFDALSEGPHSNCTISVTDAAGNTSLPLNVNSFTIDLTSPVISEVTPVTSPTNNTKPNYVFTTNETGKITYAGGCTSTKTSTTAVGDNTITFSTLATGTYSSCTIKLTDDAGNISNTLSVSPFRIDTIRPVLTIITKVKNPTNDVTPDFTFKTTEEGAIDYWGGDCSSETVNAILGNNTITFNTLAEGTHANCKLSVTDEAGNVSKYTSPSGVVTDKLPVNNFRIDTTKPIISQITAVTNPTNDVTPSYKFSSNEAGMITYGGDCKSLTVAALAGTNTVTFNSLTSGVHDNCTISVTDTAGNISDILPVNMFLVDVAKPTIVTITKIPSLTNDSTPDYTFSTTEAGTISYGTSPCKSSTTTAVGGPNTITFTSLKNASYSTCSFVITDAAGNKSLLHKVPTFRVDATAPLLKQITAIPSSTRNTAPSYTFYSNEAGTITYGGDCSSATSSTLAGNKTIKFNTLPEGVYNNCTITVTDSASNPSLALTVKEFKIDTTAPIISEKTPVKNPSNDTTPDYVFTTNETGKITYAGGCTSTKTSTTAVGDNTITFSTLATGTYSSCTMKLTDAAGNVSTPLSVSPFRIDITKPVLTRIAPVPTTTNDSTPSYTFKTTEIGTINYPGDCSSETTEASLGNNTITFNTLSEGTHANCKLSVTDEAGNISLTHAVNSFTINTDEFPLITEVIPVPLRTSSTRPSYTFDSTEAGTISYKGSCLSTTNKVASIGPNTITFNALAQGTYSNCTVQVINSSSKPSNYLVVNTFTIDTTKPVLTVKKAVPPRTGDNTPEFKFNSTEAGSITYGGDCSSVVNAALVGENTIIFNELVEGTHSNCTIKVTDDVGNLSAALLVTSFYVDLTGPVLKEVTKVPVVTIDTTPNYTFSTNEAGTITYQGSCSSIKTSASAGNNTITFNTLPYGTYPDCKILVTDKYTNISTPLDVTQFTIQDKILKEITSVATLTNDTTPEYVFSSSRTGILKYSGGCTSTSSSAVMGNNVINFNALADSTYSSCLIKLYNSSSVLLNTLTVSPFTIDTVVPMLSEVTAVQSPTEDTTPEYTFSSSEAGDATYSGGCTSETESIQEGNNTIVFDELELGTYSDCKILVEDLAGNSSELMDVTSFTVHDVTSPVLTETDPVETPTTDTTPEYIFNSNEPGTIIYSGSCSSGYISAVTGDNFITFNELPLGIYSNCQIKVVDGVSNESLPLNVSEFEIISP